MLDCSKDLLSRAQRGNVGLFIKFQPTNGASEIVVATTHLFWDPTQEDVKLLQTQRLLHHLERFVPTSTRVCTVLAGDFNSLPGSEVYEHIIGQGRFASAYLQPRKTADGRSELAEPPFTNVNGVSEGADKQPVPSFVGTLDYIFYRSNRCAFAVPCGGCSPTQLKR